LLLAHVNACIQLLIVEINKSIIKKNKYREKFENLVGKMQREYAGVKMVSHSACKTRKNEGD